MPVKMLSVEDLLEMIGDSKMSPDLMEPRRCKRCEQILTARIEGGRLLHVCVPCEEDSQDPRF